MNRHIFHHYMNMLSMKEFNELRFSFPSSAIYIECGTIFLTSKLILES